jgi:putative tryptophan/tyrosine transport system substrate-binding protein
VNRREAVTFLGGASVAWPLAARAQPAGRLRKIGVLMNTAVDSAGGRDRLATFVQTLSEAGWAQGRTVQIETRWGAGSPELFRKDAVELVTLAPDVILAATTPAVTALQRATRTIPIVFVAVVDPVGSGLVESMARPGGNATGFVVFEYALAAKWLELLREIAPGVTRAAVLREPGQAAGIGQFAAIQTVGSAGLELSVIDLRETSQIERAIEAFARQPNSGLIVTASLFGSSQPGEIAELAARYKLPAVYPFNYFVTLGGLISYGPEVTDEFRRSAGYVARILKGEAPADLPVQAPTHYKLTINLKTAKALGLTVPPSLLARADEVIE